MKAVLIIVMVAAAVWAYPKYWKKDKPLGMVQQSTAPQVVKVEQPVKPGGPGDAALVRVKQLEEVLKRFKTSKGKTV